MTAAVAKAISDCQDKLADSARCTDQERDLETMYLREAIDCLIAAIVASQTDTIGGNDEPR